MSILVLSSLLRCWEIHRSQHDPNGNHEGKVLRARIVSFIPLEAVCEYEWKWKALQLVFELRRWPRQAQKLIRKSKGREREETF